MRFSATWNTAAALLLSAMVVMSCSDGSSQADGADAEVTLKVLAFPETEPAWTTMASAFAATPEGAEVAVDASYGSSAEQSRAVESGTTADVVNVSVEPDIARLVETGKVDENWDAGVTEGIPFGSVVSLVVRPGNPENIDDWGDLLRPDVEVITASPLSSGSAWWNLLAPYAWASGGGQDPQAGLDYVRELVTDHVRLHPASDREASEAFRQGNGDVLLTSEVEALSVGFEQIHPPQTMKIESPVAVVGTGRHLEQAVDLVNFLFTAEAQKLWAEAGFRPVDPGVLADYTDEFPAPQTLWTVDELGGWEVVEPQLFDEHTGAITKIYRQATR
ncbi:extracellular solute-binding protein [Mycolicibacterium sp. 3033]|nr:extracellular solute-binding protein [Mycolicibacterium aurantiacum]